MEIPEILTFATLAGVVTTHREVTDSHVWRYVDYRTFKFSLAKDGKLASGTYITHIETGKSKIVEGLYCDGNLTLPFCAENFEEFL